MNMRPLLCGVSPDFGARLGLYASYCAVLGSVTLSTNAKFFWELSQLLG